MPLDIFDANERLQRLIDGIGTLASGVGTAKQVLDFVSEQKNVLLATHSRPFLDGTHPSCNGRKCSAAEAVLRARATEEYQRDLARLMTDSRNAHTLCGTWEAEKCKLDGLRSLLAFEREGMQ